MLKLNLNPTQKHLADIENWLIEEWNKTNSGFYCNWNIIANAITENNLSVILENDYVIGFVVYRIHEFYAVIDIAEIKPSERKKGVAKKLINGTLEHFKQKGALVAKLYCSPENSEPFWKKIGFENFPELPHDTNINMFKPLVETLQPTEKTKSNSIIRLWNCEPYQTDYVNAKWTWELTFTTDNETLDKPIIFPTSNDWQVELIRNGEKVMSDKVKRFHVDLAHYGSFMIIQKLSL